MSFDTFMADPKTYLSGHSVLVRSDNSVLQAMTAAAPVDCLSTTLKSQRWSQKPGGPFLTMMHLIAHGAPVRGSFFKAVGVQVGKLPFQKLSERTYQVFSNGNIDKGFRWLQFVENTCTYMQVDAAATLVMTGPLSGCTVAFGLDNGGTPLMLHANCNRAAGPAARMQQAHMIIDVCQNQAAANAGHLAHAEYGTDYAGMGFVFARRSGTGWKVYAYGTESGLQKVGEV